MRRTVIDVQSRDRDQFVRRDPRWRASEITDLIWAFDICVASDWFDVCFLEEEWGDRAKRVILLAPTSTVLVWW